MKKFVTVQTENDIYKLRFGLNQLILVEELLGRSITELQDKIDFKDLRVILYCGLSSSMKDLTLEQSGECFDDMVQSIGMEELMTKLFEAINSAMGKQTDKAELQKVTKKKSR